MLGVNLCFAIDTDLGKQPVGFGDCFNDLIGRRVSHDVLDGGQEVLAHDRIMFRLNAQRAVLLSNQLDGRTEGLQVIDVCEVSADRPRQCIGLCSGMLVRLVEERLYFRVSLEHSLVETPCDRFSVRSNGRCDGLNGLHRVFTEHLDRLND